MALASTTRTDGSTRLDKYSHNHSRCRDEEKLAAPKR
jgi:hypothetical protein